MARKPAGGTAAPGAEAPVTGAQVEPTTKPAQKPTVSHMLGEMVWLLSQSPIYKRMAIADLEWLIMPPLMLEQYRIVRGDQHPLGFALWAHLTPEAEERLNTTSRLEPADWHAGNLDAGHLADTPLAAKVGPRAEGAAAADAAPQTQLWLVELVCPFATPENKLTELMLADLIKGPFKGQSFKFHQTDPKTGEKTVISVGGK